MLPPAKAQAEALNLTVNSTVDEDDASPGDGICATAGGVCTLRAAITETNAWPGRDSVSILGGTYYGTTVEISDSLQLSGQKGFTILDGWSIHLESVSEDFTVSISGVTLQNGGGISGGWNGQDIVIEDCQIINNHNTGIIARGGNLDIYRSIISGNVDTQPEDGSVGGIIASISNLGISQSIISNNTGAWGGISSDWSMLMSGSTVSNNTGTDGPGGMRVIGARIVNSTISGNTGTEGAGIWTNRGIEIYSSTITQNSAVGTGTQIFKTGNGGGIYFFGDGSTTLYNTIIAENHSSAGSNDCDGPITSGGYNLIGSTTGCEFASAVGDLLNVPARLGPLQDNNGSTFTHALLPGSLAIDAANPEGSAETEGLDQRGWYRNRDSNGDGFDRDDIGAYEADGPTLRNIELSGQIDLYPRGFDIQGNYAYVGTNGRLLIMDITDPIHPRKIAATPTGPDDLGPLVTGGDYVYYLTLDQQSMYTYMVNLHIINVSDPTHPIEIGFLSLGKSAHLSLSLAVSGGHVYISGLESGMAIVDATDPSRPARVKTLLGFTQGLAIQGQYLYASRARGGVTDLLVLDISIPASPSLVGTADEIGGTGPLLIHNNYVYTTDPWFGLHVIDISDPAYPQQVNPELRFTGELLAAGGDQVYLRLGQTIQVININLPANPGMVGSFHLPDSALLLADTSGQYLFAAHLSGDISAVRVFDASDPSGLYEIWSIHNTGMDDFEVSGNTIYALNVGGLNILSTATPGSPVTIGSYSWASGHPGGITVQDTHAYVTLCQDDGTGKLLVLDVSSPANVVEIGGLSFAHPVYSPMPINSLPGSPFIYLQTEDHQLALVNVSDPLHPTLAGYYGAFQGFINDFIIYDSTLYLLERKSATDGQFHSLDISYPATPQPLASVALEDPADMDLEGGLMYIADSPGSVYIFNVDNPAVPVEVAVYDTGAPDDAHFSSVDVDGTRIVYSQLINDYYSVDMLTQLVVTGLAELQSGQEPAGMYTLIGSLVHAEMTGNRAYLGTYEPNGQSHLQALDLSAPANLVFAGEAVLGTNFGGLGVAMDGNYAYEIGGDHRLHVFDIQDPEAPTEIGACDLPISQYYYQIPAPLAVSGSYVYIGSNDGLFIVDASDPHLPVLVYEYLTTGTPFGVVIQQPYAYMGDAESFKVLDVSDPRAPILIGAYAVDGSGLAIEGDYAYISNWQDGGMLILDISNPSLPTLVTSYTGQIQYPSAIAVDDGRAFIVASRELHILDVSNPVLPLPLSVHPITDNCSCVYLEKIVVKEGYAYLLRSLWMGGGPGVRCSQLILDVSNPEAPVLAGSVETGLSMHDIFVDESSDMVYLADLNKTLSSFRFDPGAVAVPPSSYARLRSATGDVLLDLPVGLFNATARVTYTAYPQASHPLDPLVFAGHSFSLQSTIPDLNHPAYITVSYTDYDIRGLDEKELRLYYWDTVSNSWLDAIETCGPNFTYLRSPVKNQLSLDVCKFGEFALFAPVQQFLPYSIHLPIIYSRPPVYVISGYITEDNGYTPLGGVLLNCNGATALSNVDRGRYSLNVPAATCTLTPSLVGYTFTPSSITLTVPPHASYVNFIGTRLLTSPPMVVPHP